MLLQSIISGILVGMIYSLIAVGLSLIWGIMELVNFAHGSYLMLSMYIRYALSVLVGFDPLLSMPIAAILLYFLGVVTYKAIISRIMNASMLLQIFTTFGLQFLINYIMFFVAKPTFRTVKISFLDGVVRVGDLFLDKAMLVASVILYFGLHLFESVSPVYEGGKGDPGNHRQSEGCTGFGGGHRENVCVHMGNQSGPCGRRRSSPLSDSLHLPDRG